MDKPKDTKSAEELNWERAMAEHIEKDHVVHLDPNDVPSDIEKAVTEAYLKAPVLTAKEAWDKLLEMGFTFDK